MNTSVGKEITHYRLSKSKIGSGSQCEKRLYLEVHHPELMKISPAAQARFDTGHVVGEAARNLYPDGILVGHTKELPKALADTRALLARDGILTLFEPAFEANGVLVRCDILKRTRKRNYHLIEVKSATTLKEYHLLDAAAQAYVLKQAGLTLGKVEIALINTKFVYDGAGGYADLFIYEEVTQRIAELEADIPTLVKRLRAMLAGRMPKVAIGPHCHNPFECPFQAQCWPKAAYPVWTLPHGGKLIWALLQDGYVELKDVPQSRLKSERHRRMWRTVKRGTPVLSPDARKRLGALPYPRYYLDFETVMFAVPVWKGTRPYEALPFQFSCHVEQKDDHVDHIEFLHDEGTPPMRAFAEAVIEAVGKRGPVLVYSHYEKRILNALAVRFPNLKQELAAIMRRLVDLRPITEQSYYHPAMQGSWSIKSVLPTIAPELDYEELGEIHDGGAASVAYLELIAGDTTAERRQTLRGGLLKYCERDTLAMIEVARFLQHGKRRKQGE